MACLLLVRLLHAAASAGLRVDPDDPPVREPPIGAGSSVLAEPGAVRVRFPGTEEAFDARGAAVVSLAPGAVASVELRAEGTPLGQAERHWLVPVRAGEDALDTALRWAVADGVDAAIPDLVLGRRPATFDDPGYDAQWHLEDLGMEALYAETLGDFDVRVAVIDGAVDVAHPDLAAAVVAPRDVVDDDDDPSPLPGDECPAGVEDLCDAHGTSVAGLATARADNGVGVVGLCPQCSLVPIRLVDDDAPLSAEILAFEHAIEQDAAVINNSWQYSRGAPASAALAEVIARATTEPRGGLGAVVVFAAGNGPREVHEEEMVGLPGVLCVSALDRSGQPTRSTNHGDPVDLAAPTGTVTLAPGGRIEGRFGGTSAAAPIVSGVVGWVRSYAPELSAAEVVELLTITARKPEDVTFDADGHHPRYGFGVIDPTAILAALDVDEPTSTGTTTSVTETSAGPRRDSATERGCGCDGSAGAGGWLAPGLLWPGILRRRVRQSSRKGWNPP